MSFSFETKNELCRLPVQKLCCARAEAYGVLLYCNTFTSSQVRIITGNPNLAARLPRLFHRAFRVGFDRTPEEQQPGKLVFQITDREKIAHIINQLGYDPAQNPVLHINFGILRRSAAGRPSCGACSSPAAASPIPSSATIWSWPPPTCR